jgi:hypothetical protein
VTGGVREWRLGCGSGGWAICRFSPTMRKPQASFAAGSSTEKRVPSPDRPSAHTRPPCASTSCFGCYQTAWEDPAAIMLAGSPVHLVTLPLKRR